MLNVALTGNIAAGKSSVAELFRRWGATVLDADAIVREVQRPGTPVTRRIAERFGDAVVRPAGHRRLDARCARAPRGHRGQP